MTAVAAAALALAAFFPAPAGSAPAVRYALLSGPAAARGLPVPGLDAVPCVAADYADHAAWIRWRDYPRTREYDAEPARIRVRLATAFVAPPETWKRSASRALAFAPGAELYEDPATGVLAARLSDRLLFFSFPDGFSGREAFVARFADRFLFFSRSAPPERAFPAVVEP